MAERAIKNNEKTRNAGIKKGKDDIALHNGRGDGGGKEGDADADPTSNTNRNRNRNKNKQLSS